MEPGAFRLHQTADSRTQASNSLASNSTQEGTLRDVAIQSSSAGDRQLGHQGCSELSHPGERHLPKDGAEPWPSLGQALGWIGCHGSTALRLFLVKSCREIMPHNEFSRPLGHVMALLWVMLLSCSAHMHSTLLLVFGASTLARGTCTTNSTSVT